LQFYIYSITIYLFCTHKPIRLFLYSLNFRDPVLLCNFRPKTFLCGGPHLDRLILLFMLYNTSHFTVNKIFISQNIGVHAKQRAFSTPLTDFYMYFLLNLLIYLNEKEN
jgi:hypothetical protein